MQLEIIYEDDELIAINKPHGLLVHRSSIAMDAEVFALQLVRDYLGEHVYPFHRLDRKTAGVLIFAKNKEAAAMMQHVFSLDSTTKKYHCIVRGFFPAEIMLDHPLTNLKGVSQEAQTLFRCLQHFELDIPLGKHATSRYAYIVAEPKTGRMHQIRKHLNHLRFPIIGDRPHGCNKQNKLFLEKWNMSTMMLHAKEVDFIHPKTGIRTCLQANYQNEFKRVLKLLNTQNLLPSESKLF
jgi:tRNA pseudouridine65 synthase